MKRILVFAMLCFMLQSLGAQSTETGNAAFTESKELIVQISSLPELKLGFTERLRFPFLQGSSPLTEDNNIELALSAEVTPVSLNGLVEAIWTPIAFFQVAAGGRIGGGWNIELFGGDIYGSAITLAGPGGEAEVSGGAFDGLLYKVQAGAVLQADLAAFYPGDWHHVVFRTYHEINYSGYSRAKGYQSWYFENDDGENVNGFNYYGNALLGYQMPILVNMVALLAEAELYLYDTPNRSQWGDERIRWTFSCIVNFKFNEHIGLALLAQFQTQRNYEEPNWKDLYYRNRTINTADPLRLDFYRVAAIASYTF